MPVDVRRWDPTTPTWRSYQTGHTTPPAGAGGVLMGSSINYTETLESLESNSGATMDAVRVYNGGPLTAWPSSWAAHAGHRGVVASWKPNLTAIAAGDTTARNGVLSTLAGIPTGHDVWVSILHEPENGEYTTTAEKAAYRSAWAWFGDQVHALDNPRIRSCWIMMAYSWCLSSGRDPLDWWPGDGYVDVAGVDTYNEGSLNATQRWDSWGLDLGLPAAGESLSPKGGGYRYGGFAPWAEGKSLPWMVCEWGTIQNHNAPTPAWCTAAGIPATKAAWLEHGIDWLTTGAGFGHYQGMTLFNSLGRTRSGESWPLANGAPATYEAWGRAVRKHQRGDLR